MQPNNKINGITPRQRLLLTRVVIFICVLASIGVVGVQGRHHSADQIDHAQADSTYLADQMATLPAECQTQFFREISEISIHTDDPRHVENADLIERCSRAVNEMLDEDPVWNQSRAAARDIAPTDGLINFETPHVHPIDITPDGNTLVAINIAAHMLEVYQIVGNGLNHTASIPVGLDPVSVRARTNSEVWVVNHVSDSVSVVDLTLGSVVRTLDTDNEPADVVFAGSPQRAFVTASEANAVNVFDLSNLDAAPQKVSIFGEDPRALAVSADGSAVYAAIFESGNNTRIVGATGFSGGGTITRGSTLADNDVAIINANTLGVQYQSGLMTMVMALDVHPTTNQISVVGTESLNDIALEPNVNGIFSRVNLAMFPVGGSEASVAIDDLNPHLDYSSATVSQALRDQSIGDPRGIAWRNSGAQAFVTGMGSNNVVVVDAQGGRIGRFEVGEGPTGIVLKDSANLGYVMNKFAGSISIIDLNNQNELQQVAFDDPTPQAIKDGRPFLYDTHLTSGLGHVSCASCHVDSRTDRLAWDLGDPNAANALVPEASNFLPGGLTGNNVSVPGLKGPMTTQTLVDIMDYPRLHWRGDRADLTEFNPAFVNLMGDDAQLTTGEMQQLGDFLATIWMPPNPYRNMDDSRPNTVTLPDGSTATSSTMNALRGQNSSSNNCLACHSGQGNATRNFGVNDEIGSEIIAPALPGLYDKMGFTFGTSGFGFFHNGATDLFEATRQRQFLAEILTLEGPSGPLTGGELRQAPHAGVGTQLTMNGSPSSAETTLLNQLQNISSSSPHAVLIAKAKLNGIQRGFVLLSGDTFQSDRLNEQMTLSQLLAAAASGEPVTFTLVADGTETRIALDADNDGILNGDEALTVQNPGSQTTFLGESVSLQLNAFDPDSDPITFSASNLPNGLTLNSSTGLISGSPTVSGVFNVTVTVDDNNGETASESFTWTVLNNPPQVTDPSDQSSLDWETVSLPIIATDPDNDALTFSASNLPDGLSINATTGVIAGTLTSAETANVTVSVDDGNGNQESVAFVWTVSADADQDGISDENDSDADNDGIVNDSETRVEIALNSWTAFGSGTSSSGNTITYNGSGANGWTKQLSSVRMSTLGFTDNYEISWRVSSSPIGNYSMIGLGITEASRSYTDIDFAFYNITNGNLNIYESGASRGNVGSISQDDILSIEVSNGQLKYKRNGAVLRTVNLTGSPDFYIDTSFYSGAMTYADFIVTSIGGSADSDADGDGVLNLFDLDSDNDSIADVVEAGLTDADNNFIVDDVANEQGSVTQPPDSDGDGTPDFLDIDSNNDGIFDIDDNGFGGLDTNNDGTLNASDTNGGTDINNNGVDDLLETVLNNNPPVIDNPSNQFNAINDSVNLTVTATDIDGDTLTFSASNLPNGLSISSAGNISGQPNAAGTYNVTVSADDGLTGIDSTTFSWTISDEPSFECQPGLMLEQWNNIPGALISDLTSNPRYPAQPDSSAELTDFAIATNTIDEYGVRVRGYLIAPETGQYTFWIASDDNGSLRLSTDDSPANASEIARVDSWTFANEFDKLAGQQSAAISLVAGQRYYVEALMKEFWGGDNLSVAWQTPSNARAVISNANLCQLQASGDAPVASFTADVTSGEAPLLVNFDGTGSADSDGSIVSYNWNFGDGSTASGSTVSHPFISTGVYDVVLTVTDNDGMSSMATTQIAAEAGETSCANPGLTLKTYSPIFSISVADLLNDASYPDSPTDTTQLSDFEIPTNVADGYGAWAYGYVTAPVTGQYTFWIASDDNGSLRLSSDTNPANVTEIATVSHWTPSRQWDLYPEQQSAEITLVAGQMYYIEAFMQEYGGGDNLAVAWQTPGGSRQLITSAALCVSDEINPGSAPVAVLDATPAIGEAPLTVTFDGSSSSDADGPITSYAWEFGDGLTSDAATPGTKIYTNAGTYDVILTVTDSDGRTAQATTQIIVTDPDGMVDCSTNGVYREIWTNIWSDSVSALTGDSRYPNQPNSNEILSTLQVPSNANDGYGSRMRGYLVAPETGLYTFWVASDNEGQLWLSNDVSPTNATQIAQTGWSPEQGWDFSSSQRSADILLVEGEGYYIEGLHQASWGSDYYAVAWQTPSGSRELIPNSALCAYPASTRTTRDIVLNESPASTQGLARAPFAQPVMGASQIVGSFPTALYPEVMAILIGNQPVRDEAFRLKADFEALMMSDGVVSAEQVADFTALWQTVYTTASPALQSWMDTSWSRNDINSLAGEQARTVWMTVNTQVPTSVTLTQQTAVSTHTSTLILLVALTVVTLFAITLKRRKS